LAARVLAAGVDELAQRPSSETVQESLEIEDAPPPGVALRNRLSLVIAHRRREVDLREAEGFIQTIVENACEGFLVFAEAGAIVSANAAARGLFGYPDDALIGRDVREVICSPGVDARALPRSGTAIARPLDGDELAVELFVRRFQFARRQLSVAIVRDLDIRERARSRMAQTGFYDPLTGVANRALFDDRLRHALLRAQREPGASVAVLFIDLDDFKAINDSLGHRAGDRVLAEVARRLVSCMRRADTVGRYGGDEFVVMLERLRGGRLQAERIARRILDRVGAPFELGERVLQVGASVGIALDEGGSLAVDELLDRADRAMYQVKRAGKAGVSFVAEPAAE
ncbi:MAG: diguanylate cyclase, partial [Myxococcales bacterium]|nr:diguanylate cyclase [Myxococcales bacterium]